MPANGLRIVALAAVLLPFAASPRAAPTSTIVAQVLTSPGLMRNAPRPIGRWAIEHATEQPDRGTARDWNTLRVGMRDATAELSFEAVNGNFVAQVIPALAGGEALVVIETTRHGGGSGLGTSWLTLHRFGKGKLTIVGEYQLGGMSNVTAHYGGDPWTRTWRLADNDGDGIAELVLRPLDGDSAIRAMRWNSAKGTFGAEPHE